MTFKDVEEVRIWLEEVKRLDTLIDAKIAEREQLWTLATKTTTSISGMPHGSDVSDKVGNTVVKLQGIIENINSLIDKYIDHKQQVIEAIERLPTKEYAVLHRFYIRYMTINEIAYDLTYSASQVKRIKKKALKFIKDDPEWT